MLLVLIIIFHGILKLICHTLRSTRPTKLLLWVEKHESIGRPLPNRINFIVSKTIDQIEGAHVFTSTEKLPSIMLRLCIKNSLNEIVVIGGGYLFRDTLSVTNKLVLTRGRLRY